MLKRKWDLQAQNEALKEEVKNLKIQLHCARLQNAMARFQWLPECEQQAVETCYGYIGENYDGWLVREDFVLHYLTIKWLYVPLRSELEWEDLPF